jgi:magnesium-transporting ATPase (P-type)
MTPPGGNPGYQPGGYGNQSGLPSFPPAPPSMESQSRRPAVDPPGSIVGSFWCYVAAAVISVIGALLLLGQKDTIANALRDNNTTSLTESQIQAAANTAVVISLVFTIIIAALFVFFAFKLKAGRNWARIVLTIVAVLALLSLLVGAGSSSILGIIGDLAAVVGAILSYVPQSNQYIAATKMRLRGGGYQ